MQHLGCFVQLPLQCVLCVWQLIEGAVMLRAVHPCICANGPVKWRESHITFQTHATRLYRVHAAGCSSIHLEPVLVAVESLDPRFVFMLDTGPKVFVWYGKKSKNTCKSKARYNFLEVIFFFGKMLLGMFCVTILELYCGECHLKVCRCTVNDTFKWGTLFCILQLAQRSVVLIIFVWKVGTSEWAIAFRFIMSEHYVVWAGSIVK
jgi:hypothetical protein